MSKGQSFFASIRKHSNLGAYILLVIGLITVFSVRDNDLSQQRRHACEAHLAERLVLRDIVVSITLNSQSPQASAFRQLVFDRLEIPPSICNGVDIDVKKFFEDNDVLVPGLVTTTTAPTTTTPSTGQSLAPTTQVRTRSSIPRSSRSNTTTTTAPPQTTTTTTTPPPKCEIAINERCVIPPS